MGEAYRMFHDSHVFATGRVAAENFRARRGVVTNDTGTSYIEIQIGISREDCYREIYMYFCTTKLF